MTGFAPMLRKEIIEIVRTWRVWLVGVAFVLFGLSDPIIAKYTPQILGAVVGDQLPITVPEPSYLDAWSQWTKDLSQLLLIVVLILAAGAVAAEANSQTLIMPLTKPVSRTGFVLAKFVALVGLMTLGLVIGTGLVSGVTALLFDDVEFGSLWGAVGVWWLLAVLMIALTLVASCLVPNTIAAFGLGFAAFIVLNMAALWQPARAYSPVGLPTAVSELARGGEPALGWPIGSALVATVMLIVVAALIFRRRPL